VRVNHDERVKGRQDAGKEYEVEISPEDSIRALKERIASVISKIPLDPDLLQLSFGPSEKLIGKRFSNDPLVNEEDTFVKQYSFLEWIERFPHWSLTVRMAEDTPPPPGVAIKKAAASAEKEDPEQAVQEAYRSGELLRPEELPAPWGPKGIEAYKRDPLVRSIGDNPVPPNYGKDSTPSNTKVKAGKAGWEAANVEIMPNILDLE